MIILVIDDVRGRRLKKSGVPFFFHPTEIKKGLNALSPINIYRS